MARIQVVHTTQDEGEVKKAELSSRHLYETETDRIALVRIGGGTTGGWHHHGSRTMYGYVISGSAEIEYGNSGHEKAKMSRGDVFVIPPGLIHRDVNPNSSEATLLILNIGEGPTSVDVSGPEK